MITTKKVDCFAFEHYEWGSGCRIINTEDYDKEYCEKCKFYKTREQLEEEEKKAQQRLKQLGYDASRYTYV